MLAGFQLPQVAAFECPPRTTWLRQQGHLATTAIHDEQHSSIKFKVQAVDFTVHIDESDPGFILLTHGFLRFFCPKTSRKGRPSSDTRSRSRSV